MPTLMFNGRKDNFRTTNNSCLYQLELKDFRYQIHGSMIVGYGKDANNIFGPTRIKYCDTEEKLDLAYINDNNSCYIFGKYDFQFLGTRKLEDWSFEKEVRFGILTIPENSLRDDDWLSPIKLNELKVDTEFIDIPLDKSTFDETEITLGPQITNSEKIIVETLCNKYAPNVKINSSQILIR